MRLWLLIPGSILLIVGILMMFSIAFSFVVGIFQEGGLSAITIWHVALPLVPVAVGLAMVWFAPKNEKS